MKKQNGIEVVRFYPTEKIVETKTQQEYENTIHELGRIMSNTMECIAKNGLKESVYFCDWRKGQYDSIVMCQ